MTEARMRTGLRGTAVVAVVAAFAGMVLVASVRGWSVAADSYTPYSLIVAAGLGVIVWLAAGEQAGNRLIWVLVASSAGTALFGLGEGVRLLLDPNGPVRMAVETTVPAEVDTTAAWLFAVTITLTSAASTLLTSFGILLFPDGRLPSKRWRPVAALIVLAMVIAAGLSLAHWYPHSTVIPNDRPTFPVSSIFNTAITIAAVVGLLSRFRGNSANERSRIKWVLWGLGVFVIVTFVGFNLGSPLVTIIGFAALFTAYGIGIVRHNLFDVNVVISRTVTYAALAALIGLLYVTVVVGIGSLLGSGDEPNPVLAVAATALVAVAFQPVRSRLQRLANRLVFGRRATPYEVLADFSRRVAATSDTLLDDAARSLVEGTAAECVVVSLDLNGDIVEAASWPNVAVDIAARHETVRFPITQSGSRLGTLEVRLPADQTMPDDERHLVEHVASGMGLALGNQVLSEGLAARVDDLRRSQRRLVAVQDDTRRRLERDLHDGAQQQLVALKVKLGLFRSMAESAGHTEMSQLVERLSGEADAAVESLRDFARGVYPPLLEAEGLEAAIVAQVRRSNRSIEVDIRDLGRYPREVESTVYFCVLEALGAVAGQTGTSGAHVHLAQHNGSLTFRIHDAGGVTSPAEAAVASGLGRIEERLQALAGALHVTANGSTVSGTVPVVPQGEPS